MLPYVIVILRIVCEDQVYSNNIASDSRGGTCPYGYHLPPYTTIKKQRTDLHPSSCCRRQRDITRPAYSEMEVLPHLVRRDAFIG